MQRDWRCSPPNPTLPHPYHCSGSVPSDKSVCADPWGSASDGAAKWHDLRVRVWQGCGRPCAWPHRPGLQRLAGEIHASTHTHTQDRVSDLLSGLAAVFPAWLPEVSPCHRRSLLQQRKVNLSPFHSASPTFLHPYATDTSVGATITLT